MEITSELAEAWLIHNRVILFALDGIAAEAFDTPSPARGKGRKFSEMLAHIHNVRLMWLEAAAPELMTRLSKIGRGAPDAPVLNESLCTSGEAVATLLTKACEDEEGKVKGFKRGVAAFMAYLIAHESYHLGEIGIALREAGYPLDKETAAGLWEWGKR